MIHRQMLASAAAAVLWMTCATHARGQDMPLSQVLIDGEGWQLVSEGHQFTEGPAADAHGNVFFTDVPEDKIWRIDAATGKATLFADHAAKPSGMMFMPDGRLIANRGGEKKIVAYKPDGSYDVIADDVNCNDLVVTKAGDIYVTDVPNKAVVLINAKGEKRVVAQGWRPNGIILVPGEGTLVITDSDAPHLWAYRVEPDGGLTYGAPWYKPVRTPVGNDRPGSDGMTVDNVGRLYLASYVGVQVFDTTARPSGVILMPQDKFLSNVCFGGEGFQYLYATCTDKVYRRKTKTAGVPTSLQSPHKR
jgi:gluconolactonase